MIVQKTASSCTAISSPTIILAPDPLGTSLAHRSGPFTLTTPSFLSSIPALRRKERPFTGTAEQLPLVRLAAKNFERNKWK